MVTFNFSLPKKQRKDKEVKNKEVYGVIRGNGVVPYGDLAKYADVVGVYYIKSKTSNKQYVGSSKNIQRRIGKHFSELKYNRHRDKDLQEEYNLYGYDNFECGVYETCNIDELLIKEKEWQVKIGIDNLYNQKISGYYITEELRKMHANADKSTHKTQSYRDKMSKLKSNYIAQYDLNHNLIKIWDSAKEVCDTLGYTRSVILSGCNGSKKHPYGYYWRYCDSKGNTIYNGYSNKQD